MRQRALGSGAKLYNGLFLRMEQKDGPEGSFKIDFSNYEEGGKVCRLTTSEMSSTTD